MIKNLSIAAILAVSAVPAVQAANLVVFQPEPMATYAPGFSWTGFYVGANAGYGWGVVDTNIAGAPNYNTRGFAGGIHAGYNYDIGGFVLGAEADFSFSDSSILRSSPERRQRCALRTLAASALALDCQWTASCHTSQAVLLMEPAALTCPRAP